MSGASTILGAIGEALSEMVTWVGSVITAITSGAMSQLLVPFAIGIGVSILLVAVHIIRKVTYGA